MASTGSNNEKNVVSPSSTDEKRLGKRKRYNEEEQDEDLLDSAKKIQVSNDVKKIITLDEDQIMSEPSTTNLGMMNSMENDDQPMIPNNNNKVKMPTRISLEQMPIRQSQIQNESLLLLESVVLPKSSSDVDVKRTINESILRNEKNHNEIAEKTPFVNKKADKNDLHDTVVDKEKNSKTSTTTLPSMKEDVKNDDDDTPVITETKDTSKQISCSKTASSTNQVSRLSFTSLLKQHVKLGLALFILIGSYHTYVSNGYYVDQNLPAKRLNPHVRPPHKYKYTTSTILNLKSYLKTIDSSNTNHEKGKLEVQEPELSDVTLRQYLSHPEGFHLAMAPAFFGFYAYFGALIAFNEEVLTEDDELTREGYTILPSKQKDNFDKTKCMLKSTVGASAGAMAAVLLASGLDPRTAADFASSLTLSSFADPPGVGGILKGDVFEALMKKQMRQQQLEGNNSHNFQLENALIPVAVSAFDLMSMSGRILSKGCMARAARASATFPGLFQPVLWDDRNIVGKEGETIDGLFALLKDFSLPPVLIDGGVTDTNGYLGLSAVSSKAEGKRVVNLVVGNFHMGSIPGPSVLRSNGIEATEVVSITIENSPVCGPWAMENGPKAVHAVRQAVIEVLDFPMYVGNEPGHFILHIDASKFVPPA